MALGCGNDGAQGDDDDHDADVGDEDGATAGWSSLPDVGNGPIQEIGVAALDGKIYVVGGFDGGVQVVTTVQVYDPTTREWSTAAPLPRGVHHANLAAYNGKLYVLGAMVLENFNFVPIGDSWEYDPAGDEWTPVASMPAGTERGASAIGALADRICVAGGLSGGAVADVSCYEPASNTWDTSVPDLPAPNDHMAFAVVDNTLYVIGGRNGAIANLYAEVYAYAEGQGDWQQVADIPTPRGGMAAGVVNGKIYVVGGEGNDAVASGVFPQVEEYDPAGDAWRSLDDMLTPRHGMGAAGLGGVLYVPGGATQQGFGAVATFESFVP